MNPHRRLYSPDAAATVRETVTTTDAGGWTPTADDQILDAREWDHLHVYPEFVGGSGTTINVTPLYRMRGSDGSISWVAGTATGNIGPTAEGAEIIADGHFMTFRVTGLVLGAASSVNVRVTGGRKRRNLAGG